MSFNLNQVMANAINGNGVRIIHGEIENVNPYIEWIKWLSYIPVFQKERINELSSKNIEELTLEDLDELETYKSQIRMLNLFKAYGTNEISKEEYMEVCDFMKNQSIDKLMLSKLSLEEIEYAKRQIQHFSQIPSEELRKKVSLEKKEENYDKLSMVDAYVLHIISRFDFIRDFKRLNDEISCQINENNAMRQRSFHYATNPYEKK